MAADNDNHNRYESPLVTRYAGPRMLELFSHRRRCLAWRDLWIALARAQHELGLAVTAEQVAELEAHRETFDWSRVAELEKELRHDVMAHIRAYAELCPSAGGVIHLGATSCFVTDNADQIVYRDALREVASGLAAALSALASFARTHRDTPCLGYTHFQVAQLTTVGKRAALWAQDLLDDLCEVERLIAHMPMRGVKGATGTQASFLELFGGDQTRVRALDRSIAEAFEFERTYRLTGQTYPRKLDSRILGLLTGIAQSTARFATDIRLLSGHGELGEPMGITQVGSSSMPYKRNPMRSERICSLGRLVLSLATSPPMTASTQWLERTLDDSANRRIVLPEAFLATDGMLRLVGNVARGLEVRGAMVARRVREMMPFLATENIMMVTTAAGGDRQELHESLRKHAREAWTQVENGMPNDLIDRIKHDPAFAAVSGQLDAIIQPEQYVGRAPTQVDEFLESDLMPALAAYPEAEKWETELSV